MKAALALVAVLTLAGLALVVASPSPRSLLAGAPTVILLTAVAQAAARGASRFLIGYPSERGGVWPPRRGRVAIVAALALGLELLVVTGGLGLSRAGVEIVYYAVLACAGLSLARWCRSSEASPVWLAVGLVAALSGVVALSSGWPDAGARILLRTPLEASVTWAAWHMAAVRGHSFFDGLSSTPLP